MTTDPYHSPFPPTTPPWPAYPPPRPAYPPPPALPFGPLFGPDRLAPAAPEWRLVAFAVDFLLCNVLLLLAWLAFRAGDLGSVWFLPYGAALLLTYSPLTTARLGGTPGKRLFHLLVLDSRRHQPPTYPRALFRHLTHLGMCALGPLGLLIGHLRCTWDGLNRCSHDDVVDTVVVRG